MFDPRTAELIRQAPALGGLNLERLPEDLTKAFAEIVAARVAPSADSKEFVKSVDRLRRLANTYRALAVLLPESPERKSAAFVAASAHVFLDQARPALPGPKGEALTANSVANNIAAMLLFLVAEQFADSAAVAAQIDTSPTPSVTNLLVRGLVALGAGEIPSTSNLPKPIEDPRSSMSQSEKALSDLWKRLLEAVKLLADMIAGEGGASADGANASAAISAIESVWEASVSGLADTSEGQIGRSITGFPGPHQLAGMLRGAAGALARAAITAVPSPDGTDRRVWGKYLRRAAKRRPFLWGNHLEALHLGYLNVGTSAVLSFPTGAGKSALSELKVATALNRGKDVVFLAPTHALVSQTVRELRKSFPENEVSSSFVDGGEYTEVEDEADAVSGSIAVMTPERCLTLASQNPEMFATCGLIVFDEFHLVHPVQFANMRRSIDATLCLLALFQQAPDSDVVLISAMVSNGQEVADWVRDFTKRPCVLLDLRWKPTRQARGCVVYEESRLIELEAILKVARRASGKMQPGAAEKAQMGARPLALMCLEQTWNTTDEKDYVLLPIASRDTLLGVNKFWKVTSNRNTVAGGLACELGNAGIKTLVFVQKLDATYQIANACAGGLKESASYAPEDKVLLDAIEAEIGEAAHSFIPVGGKAACHHALMIAEERELVEQMFKREKNLAVLVATPTLAQGMNLPAEAVVMAGDDRFDAGGGGAEMLAAHELLNAAGRAGRAGHAPQGLVLVVPGKPVGVDWQRLQVGSRWHDLQRQILSQSDQCLVVHDPVQRILDAIHVRAMGQNADEVSAADLEYFVHRLPVGSNEDANEVLRRSMSGFMAARDHAEVEFSLRVGEAVKLRDALWGKESSDPTDWKQQAAVRAGVSLQLVDSIDERLSTFDWRELGEVSRWVDVVRDWLVEDGGRVFLLHRPKTLIDSFDGALNTTKKGFVADPATGAALAGLVRKHAKTWMAGAPLCSIEQDLSPKPRPYCLRARQFVLRMIPEFSYTVGLFALVARRRVEHSGDLAQMPLALATAASCIKEGVDDPRKLALRELTKGVLSRVAVHQSFKHIEHACPPPLWNETYPSLKKDIAEAYDRHAGNH